MVRQISWSHSCPQHFQPGSISIHYVLALLFSPHFSCLCFGIAALFLFTFLLERHLLALFNLPP